MLGHFDFTIGAEAPAGHADTSAAHHFGFFFFSVVSFAVEWMMFSHIVLIMVPIVLSSPIYFPSQEYGPLEIVPTAHTHPFPIITESEGPAARLAGSGQSGQLSLKVQRVLHRPQPHR